VPFLSGWEELKCIAPAALVCHLPEIHKEPQPKAATVRAKANYYNTLLPMMICMAALVSAGCTTAPKYPFAPAAEPLLEKEYRYEIGPGDSVQIFMWGYEELSGSFPVRPDGMITTYLVEDIPASGMTPTKLARNLETVYAKYVRSPVVTVIVNGFVGIPSQQIRVIGEATTPLSIPYRKHMTLLDLVIAMGGITDFADGNDTVLARHANNKQKLYRVRLDDLVRDGDVNANVNLLPGDILIVPEAWF
jgi:polysaccharide export outer membrane protein